MDEKDKIRNLNTEFYLPLGITINHEIIRNNDYSRVDTINHLDIEWSRNFNIIYSDCLPVGFEVIWGLKHIEQLELSSFPYASMTKTTTANQNNNVDDDDENLNTTMTTSTSTSTSTPLSIGSLHKTLKELFLFNCNHHQFHLPPEIGKLVNLTALTICSCSCLESLPPEIGNLTNLEYLDLDELNRLQSLPPEVGKLKNLEALSICDCNSLVTLPAEIGNLDNLEELEIENCAQLKQLPIEFNNLRKNLESLIMYQNENLQAPAATSDHIQFTNLQRLHTCWSSYLRGEFGMSWLHDSSSSLLSLELILEHFDSQDLSTLLQVPETQPFSSSLPQGIQKLSIHNKETPVNKANQDAIYVLLQTYKRLGYIQFLSNVPSDMNLLLDGKKSPGLFTHKSLHLMFFNRCGRSLLSGYDSTHAKPSKSRAASATTSTTIPQKRPLPLSMWPMILEQVNKRIGKMANEKSEQIMTASIIFSLLEGPALVNYPRGDFSS